MQHILVVDDDRSSTLMLRYLLEGEGHRVTTTDSALRALDQLEQNEVDLVLLDVVMPDMDGLDLCRRIRATSDVPIMFLSVGSDVTDKVLGLRAGADDYLTKPFDTNELLARVRVLLRRSSSVAATKMRAS